MFDFGREAHVYTLTLGWVALCALLLRGFQSTLFGRLAVALRESEVRLPALGYNTYLTKVVLFAVSGMFAGVAGALLALVNESANYLTFSVGTSAGVVLQTFIGGTQVFLGPAVGALTMTAFGYVVSDLTRSWLLYQGLLFILLMLAAPRGLAALAIDAVQAVRDGGLPALGRILAMLLGLTLAGLGLVLAFEVMSGVLTGDYQAIRAQTGQWPEVTVFWRAWSPIAPLTWLLAAAAMATGLTLVRRVTPGGRA
jgi:branched-chain amino acid transport system permease protein